MINIKFTALVLEKDETVIRNITAIISWKSKIPIDILPYNFSNASLSDNNLSTIIVEEKVSASDKYKEVTALKPSRTVRK